MTQANVIKAQVRPLDFFRAELPDMPHPRRESGWVDGGRSPLRHDQHAGSFKVNLTTGGWKDFATGDSGDVFTLIMLRDGLTFSEAVRYIEECYT